MCRLRLSLVITAWIAVVAVGTWRMMSYELTPAPPAQAVQRWPDATQLVMDSSRQTLLVFLHPECPCSRATLAELDRLLTPRRDKVGVELVFVRPAGLEAGCERTDLWATAQRISGAKVICDPEGVEARRFGARTSGETMLFTEAGRLLYDGGITGSRGHEGDNPGRDTLAALIDGGGDAFHHAPVFGCALFDEYSAAE
jgi:hypothetical protein